MLLSVTLVISSMYMPVFAADAGAADVTAEPAVEEIAEQISEEAVAGEEDSAAEEAAEAAEVPASETATDSAEEMAEDLEEEAAEAPASEAAVDPAEELAAQSVEETAEEIAQKADAEADKADMEETPDEDAEQAEIIEQLATESVSLEAKMEGEAEIVDYGTCGENLTWKYDSEGTLTISGTGEMPDYDGNAPWSNYTYASIYSIIVEDGVTSIGESAFCVCRQLQTVTIPESMMKIGKYAFDACSSLTDVFYAGAKGKWNQIDIDKGNSRLINANIQCAKEDILVTGIELDCTSADIVKPEWGSGFLQLTATITPSDATVKSIIWTSSDDRVASVSENGRVMTERAGIATITATAADGSGVTATCTVRVLLASGSCGDGLTWTLDGDYTFTISGTGEVTSLPWRTYEYRWDTKVYKDIVTVVIEDGVTNIPDNAFSECKKLTNITIPDSVTNIEDRAFRYCSGLTGIRIPESVTSIGGSAFSYCSSLTDISISEGVTSIGGSAFSYCSSLTDISIPEGVTSIGGSAFSNCSSLTDISIPESVTDIGSNAFADCSSLKSISLAGGVTNIGDYTFGGCSSLESISLPDGVTSIGGYAFGGCSSLTGITIPAGVTSIGKNAFLDCSSMADIEVDPNNSIYSSVNGVLYNKDQTTLIICPLAKTGDYSIPESVTAIESEAFKNCNGIGSVTIPDGVTEIKYSTFRGCSGLTSITIPESVTDIESSAFEGCSSLADVYYSGLRRKWDQIYISADNEPLLNAAIHTAVDVNEITLDKTSVKLHVDNTLQLTASVLPEEATDKSIIWKSDSEWVATVDAEGVVKGIEEGTATITATAADGSGVKATCTVTVFEDNDLRAYDESTGRTSAYVDVRIGEFPELRVTVSAVDESGLSCQWYKFGSDINKRVAIEGAAGTSYTVASLEENYCFEVRDQYGGSRVVRFNLQVENDLQALVEGSDISEAERTLTPGEPAEFRVTVSALDDSKLSFQWYDVWGNAIEGATDTSYTIDPSTLSGSESFEFRVRDQYGNVAYARFHVSIENHLRAYAGGTEDTEAYLYFAPGESAELHVDVSADDESKLSYQWFRVIPDWSGKLEYRMINGATGPSYTTGALTSFTRYYCRVSDQYSNTAEVRLYTCIADFGNAQTIECGDAVAVSVNKNEGGEAYPVFRFIPPQTTGYIMYSGEAVDNPYLEILDSSRNSVIRTADPFEDPAVEYDGKGYFRLEQELEAGKTYYLVVGTYSNTSSCVLHLEMDKVLVTEIDLNKTSADLEVNKTLQLTATVLPDNADDKSVTWTSSDPKTATVDKNGKVTGTGEGTTTITATAADGSGVTAACKVTVTKPSVANATVSGLVAKTYTGKALTQSPKVVLGSKLLELDTDYELSYSNNTNVGTATVTITGIGSYKGTVTKTFTILPGKTARGDMFNLANNVKVTWKEVPGAVYYKVYREGVTDSKETRKDPVIVTTGLVGWDKDPGLTNGHAYRYKIVASLTGKGDSSGDSTLSYSKLMYRLKTVVIRSVKNTAPGKVTVKYDKTESGDSYVLQYCEREDMVGAKTKVVLGAKNTSYVIGGLKKGKTYYISIRVRKKVNGIDYYTTFGVAKKIKITN